MTTKRKPKKTKLEALALSHWEYVAKTIFAHTGVNKEDRDYIICKHHYVTAFIHGHKHGTEEERKKAGLTQRFETIKIGTTK